MRGRFAPSPTGQMHLGNAWTALLAWLQVRAQGGSLVLRMEDLDPDRSREEYVQGLEADLHWLGLDWDEGGGLDGVYGPYAQDARRDLYEAALQRLQEQHLVYPCYCTRAELAASAPHGEDGERIYSGTCSGGVAENKLARKPSLRLVLKTAYMVSYGKTYAKSAATLSFVVLMASMRISWPLWWMMR